MNQINFRYFSTKCLLTLACSVMCLSSCRTVKEKPSSASSIKEKKIELNSEFSGCIGERIKCPPEKAPEYCHALLVDKKNSGSSLEFFAWGHNHCRAMNQINRQFCGQGIVGKQKGWVTCQPDSTNGNCPPVEKKPCSETKALSTCFAGYYGNQRMSNDLSMLAKGTNECQAKANLRVLACTKNLDPKKLRYISCEADKIEDVNSRR